MKLNEKKLKEMIVGELKEASSLAKWSDSKKSQRWKVYIDGEKKPLILTGRSASEVKKFAHQMIQNSSVKIKKVVKEGKLNEYKAIDEKEYIKRVAAHYQTGIILGKMAQQMDKANRTETEHKVLYMSLVKYTKMLKNNFKL